MISSEELRALVACISTALSELESRVLALYLDGHSYEEVGRRIGCDCKTVDNALQRVKRKVGAASGGAERAGIGGSRIVNSAPPVAPLPAGVAASTLPPIADTSSCTIARPRPEPTGRSLRYRPYR